VLTEIKKKTFLPVRAGGRRGSGKEKENWMLDVSECFFPMRNRHISCYFELYVFQRCSKNIRNRSSSLGATDNPHKAA